MSYSTLVAVFIAALLVLVVWAAFVVHSWFRANRKEINLDYQRQTTSPDPWPHAGVSSLKGRRKYMEDTYQAVICLNNQPKNAFFGVYDGHGGARAAEYAADHLHKQIVRGPLQNDPVRAIQQGFQETDRHFLELANRAMYEDGSTAITALVQDGMLYVGNVGDSRCVLSCGGRAIELSRDHKPTRDDEKKRIHDKGGRIIRVGIWRVQGVLAVTRALGDRRLKQFVTSEPEITTHKLGPEDDLLVLASDGIWDVLTSQQAIDIARAQPDVKTAARVLTEAAIRLNSMDNVTALVVDLSRFR